jgi:hypothetical protein
MASGHGQHGQVPNEEVPYHPCSVQDVMIEASCRVNQASSGAKLGDVLQCWWSQFKIQFREPVSQACSVLGTTCSG